MNAQSPKPEAQVAEKDLRAVLISHFNLSADDVEQIYSFMEPRDMRFGDAAVGLGFITDGQLAEAVSIASGDPDLAPIPQLFENAIRKISTDRRLVVRQGEIVKPGERLILAHSPYDARSERIRALRTELLLLNDEARTANIVPVVSPSMHEGRSQLAAELALSFAQLGRRTLLVDADMRKPQQHALFDASNDRGLSRSLAMGEKPYFFQVDGYPRMHLLAAGPVPPNPLELLSDGRFAKLLAEWRNAYEFIVIDTPPITQCADGLAIATLASRVLLVSRSQQSSYKATQEMLRRLESTQCKILGAVLNHF